VLVLPCTLLLKTDTATRATLNKVVVSISPKGNTGGKCKCSIYLNIGANRVQTPETRSEFVY
jgi:hypothetical protein